MIPASGALTIPDIPSDFLYRMRSATDLLTDYEQGGAGVQDPSGGLRLQNWTLTYRAPDAVVADEAGNATVLFSRAGITELALAFDQNMQPFVAFTDASGPWYWWYDPATSVQTFVALPAGSSSLRCTLDDHRSGDAANSDIILTYLRGTTLYYRQQRDRFLTEYTLKTGVTGTFICVGMNTGLRLQFKIRPSDY